MPSTLKRPASPTVPADRSSKIAKVGEAGPSTQQAGTESDLDLPALLDVSALTSQPEFDARFAQLATCLLHDYHLCVNEGGEKGKEYAFEILELEFYLRAPGHLDPFAHGTPEQGVSGRWYFHRAPRRSEDSSRSATSLTAYRDGSRKGLDFTFGSPYKPTITDATPASPSETEGIRGGILLRTLRSARGGKVVSGPSLLVDEVLRLCGVSSIKDLVEKKWEGDTHALDATPRDGPRLYLRKRPEQQPNPKAPRVYNSPRIGLDLSHPGTTPSVSHPRVKFVCVRYRYLTHPELLVKNGRPQTLLGILFALQDGGADKKSSLIVMSRVASTMGAKDTLVKKYLEEYEEGRKGGKLEPFVGPKGKGVGSAPAKYLCMSGVLARLNAEEEGKASE